MAQVRDKPVTVESVLADMLKLSLKDRLAVIARAAELTESDVSDKPKKPLKSLKGILAKYGPAPSAEEIDEARREMWGNFPRNDF